MKGKCVMFVSPRRGSPSPRPPVCGRGWILPRANNKKKRSRAWKSLELFRAHKLPFFVTAFSGGPVLFQGRDEDI